MLPMGWEIGATPLYLYKLGWFDHLWQQEVILIDDECGDENEHFEQDVLCGRH